jgi:transposase-like protein
MNTYKRHWFPPDIISYAVWLYYRFNLSHRDIEGLLAERGITVGYAPTHRLPVYGSLQKVGCSIL